MTNENLPAPDADGLDELELRSMVEATFGPGAFDLISDVNSDSIGLTEAPNDSLHPGNQTAVVDDTTPVEPEPAPSANGKLLLFEVSGRVFGIPVTSVSEIQREPEITRIPHVPHWVRGVTNLRGAITSVVDLRLRLGLDASPKENRRRIVVVHSPTTDVTAGLLVDEVLGIRVLPEEPASSHDAGDPVLADFTSEWREVDSMPVAVLNLDKTIDLNQRTS